MEMTAVRRPRVRRQRDQLTPTDSVSRFDEDATNVADDEVLVETCTAQAERVGAVCAAE